MASSRLLISASSAGSMYGVVMNSVENAQNIGRILGCLYPEYNDQDQWIAYYYDCFYHLNESDLAYVIDNAMDGVRNWDAAGSELTTWTTDDVADYDKVAVEQTLADGIFNVKDYGAKGDGKTLDHIAINKAIDAAVAKGGGQVLLPAGTYLCGSIHLKSDIDLHLLAGAKILASPASMKAYDESEVFGAPEYQDGGHT